MPTPATFVIAGGGLAGVKAAEALREEGFDGRIVLVAEEDMRPYERPPLSKDYLQGKTGRETIFVHPPDWYDTHAIELRVGTAVTAIDRGRREVTLSGGERLAYDKLLLATGSSPRRLRLPGEDLDGVLYLRRAADSDRIRDTFASASRVLIVGAGWIGLEVAAAARAAGVAVTILEAAELPLLHVLGPQIAPVFAGLHREHGVDLRFGVQVAQITGTGGRASGARLADGTRIGADAVIAGIGAAPNTGLAETAGLDVRNGVVTDASLRTSDPAVYAAGDVASAFHPLLRTHIRVEHWANALDQPEIAARAMLGQDAAYDRVPYFASPTRQSPWTRSLPRASPPPAGRGNAPPLPGGGSHDNEHGCPSRSARSRRETPGRAGEQLRADSIRCSTTAGSGCPDGETSPAGGSKGAGR